MITSATNTLPGPRARFPGHLMFAFRSDPLGFLIRIAAKFGDRSAFGIGRMRFVLLNDPDLIREVIVAKADQFQKSPALRQARVSIGDGLLTSEGDFHKRQRKLSQPAFHPSRVAGYSAAMVRRSRQMAVAWRDGERIDLHEQMMKLTLRVVTETLFSASIEDEIDQIGQAMDVIVRMFSRARNPLAPILNRLPLPSNRRFVRAQADVRRTVEHFVLQNRMAGVDRGDLLSTLVRARDTGGETAVMSDDPGGAQDAASAQAMSDIQLRDEIVTLFIAGHETTANALTFALWLLSQNEDAAAKLYSEIDAAGAGRDLLSADLDHLPFTRAVVAEAMRLYPPAWVLMRQAKEDVRLGSDSVRVPKMGIVIMSQWITHRDPRWWPEPETFKPERWLDDTAKQNRPKYAYFPFGGGPRSCIGEAFAWTEAVLIIATLLRDWRLEAESPKPLRLTPTITLRPKDPVWMRLRRR
ncbi:cytochrome P450 [Humisphaera borealis]|uniref:Cytochrome P450 n=1 Tax=Humisphaera borealis TaxID=2807512 RepID=A0A7M2X0L9_9BACT|nr:cytochrome P450 [Humisphaera borealis]QOV91199.1 cytochrome P450 [Humisphaera borealis]